MQQSKKYIGVRPSIRNVKPLVQKIHRHGLEIDRIAKQINVETTKKRDTERSAEAVKKLVRELQEQHSEIGTALAQIRIRKRKGNS
jgi:hypothetical protein